ncbi:MAG: tryptophan 7-halogenase, partial [Peristeroidobacter soli]
VFRFLSLLPTSPAHDPALEAEFNRLSITEYEQCRDFIILHYVVNERTEPFWQDCRSVKMPDVLAHRIELFRSRGKVAREDGHLFSDSSWIAVMLGQGITPARWDPLADTIPMADLQKKAADLREGMHRAIARMPTHVEFIEKNCKA